MQLNNPIFINQTDADIRYVNAAGENLSGNFYINTNPSINDHILMTSQCSGSITGYLAIPEFTGAYTGNYEGGYFLGRTKLTQNTIQLVESSFGNNYITKNTTALTQTFRSSALSSDGKYQIVAVNDAGGSTAGYIYVSNDYGNTWTPRITDTTRIWRGVAVSADGKYQTACHNNGFIYVSNDYGNTWTARDSSRYWNGVAMSSDGRYQTAVGGLYVGGPATNYINIYISSDYGVTWTARASANAWVCVAMSSDGKYRYAGNNLAGNGSLFKSSDFGNTWSALSMPLSNAMKSVETSADGRFLVVTRSSTANIYISDNYGDSWRTTSASAAYNNAVISADGKYMVAGVGSFMVSTGGIYFSSDYGRSWKLVTPSSMVWNVAMSSNGKYVIGTSTNTSMPIHIFKTDELIDANLTINGNLDLNGSKLVNSVPEFITETANFLISGNDNGRVILARSTIAMTGTIVSGNVTGFNTSIIQIGAGQVSVIGSGIGVKINEFGDQYKTAGIYATISLLHTGNNGYIMYGNTAP